MLIWTKYWAPDIKNTEPSKQGPSRLYLGGMFWRWAADQPQFKWPFHGLLCFDYMGSLGFLRGSMHLPISASMHYKTLAIASLWPSLHLINWFVFQLKIQTTHALRKVLPPWLIGLYLLVICLHRSLFFSFLNTSLNL